MKRFVFRLQKVLSLRTQETDQAKRALAVAIALEAEAFRVLVRARTLLAARIEDLQAKEQAGMSGFDFGNLRTHIRMLQSQVALAEQGLGEAQELKERRRLELLESRRSERALERLRERRHENYDQEVLKEEQRELDEFGTRVGLNSELSRSEI